jgi:hypothetical protein
MKKGIKTAFVIAGIALLLSILITSYEMLIDYITP